MAHIKIAVFSQTLNEAERLVQHFCTPPLNDEVNKVGQTDSKSSCSALGIIRRWSDYQIMDCVLSGDSSLQINAFITTDGELIEECQLAWHRLAYDEGELTSLFKLVFAGYVKRAEQENQKIFLVDCHI